MRLRDPLFGVLVLFAAIPAITRADVRLPAIISENMVLQRSEKVPIWGWASPGEEVTIEITGRQAHARTDPDGRWKTSLDLSKSEAGPFELSVRGNNHLIVPNVVVGEVWVASGQSNMDFLLRDTIDAEKEIAGSANPLLRQFVVKKSATPEPREDCEGKWVSANPETSPFFTGVGFHFAKRIQQETGAPVGLINTAFGGTPSEAWTNKESLEKDPRLKAAVESQQERIASLPARRQEWAETFSQWLKQTGREDRRDAESASFPTAEAAMENWAAITLPGAISNDTFPESGVVWLQKSLEIPANKAGKNLNMVLGVIEGFESVYWNGQLLTELTPQNFPGAGYVRQWGEYMIPAKQVKAGTNTLTVRIFSPVGPMKITGKLELGGVDLSGQWKAKPEYSLPKLSREEAALVPAPPPLLPPAQGNACHLFNGMINPVIPYGIRGVIWYQGEANANRAAQYHTAFPLLISGWREKWGQGDFPFYFCQLAGFMGKNNKPGTHPWAELREAQSSALALPHTGQAVTIDLGEAGDIHPRNKKDVGERLARIALARDYGKDMVFSGPTFQSATLEKNAIRIRFSDTLGGLKAAPLPADFIVSSAKGTSAPLVRNSPESEVEGFAICGKDGGWFWADAKIEGDAVLVWSKQVPEPVAVRYGWAANPTCNLVNAEGLPASPFRTDNQPLATAGREYQ